MGVSKQKSIIEKSSVIHTLNPINLGDIHSSKTLRSKTLSSVTTPSFSLEVDVVPGVSITPRSPLLQVVPSFIQRSVSLGYIYSFTGNIRSENQRLRKEIKIVISEESYRQPFNNRVDRKKNFDRKHRNCKGIIRFQISTYERRLQVVTDLCENRQEKG